MIVFCVTVRLYHNINDDYASYLSLGFTYYKVISLLYVWDDFRSVIFSFRSYQNQTKNSFQKSNQNYQFWNCTKKKKIGVRYFW